MVAAAGIRALGGDIQARLLTREVVKGDSEENRAFAEKRTPPLSGNGSRGK